MTRAEWDEMNRLNDLRDTATNEETRETLETLIEELMDHHDIGPSSWPDNWDGACTDCNTGIIEVFDADGKTIKIIHAIAQEAPAA